jgi:hypothetical protein
VCVGDDPGAKHWNGPPGGAPYGGADGPRHKAGRSSTWRRSDSSSVGAQKVRDGVEGLLRSRPRSRLSGGTPSGSRDPRVCLGVGRPPKTPLVDVEPKRGEDLRQREAKLMLN